MRKLWILLTAVIVFSFAILGWIGTEIFREAPPVPREVVTSAGETVISPDQIGDGQNVWQAMGGMEIGSIWGHGSYVAPDWTADYLHRESLFILNEWSAGRFGSDGSSMLPEERAAILARLQTVIRTNTYDAASGKLVIDPIRQRAFEDNLRHYSGIFTDGSTEYAIQKNAQSDPVRLRQLTSFFFWTAWASSTNRPGNTISYTSNFPSEPLVANFPTPSSIVWTGVSV